jgi:hypothetical protein
MGRPGKKQDGVKPPARQTTNLPGSDAVCGANESTGGHLCSRYQHVQVVVIGRE